MHGSIRYSKTDVNVWLRMTFRTRVVSTDVKFMVNICKGGFETPFNPRWSLFSSSMLSRMSWLSASYTK